MRLGRIVTTLAATLGIVSSLLAITSSAHAQGQPSSPSPSADGDAGAAKKEDDSWQNPAKAADPPLLPKTAPLGPPTSTSGTDVTQSEPPAPPTVVLAGDKEIDKRQDARLRALENRLQRDEHHIRRLEDRLRILKNLTLSAYIQPQFITSSFNASASPNVQPNGALPPNIGPNDTIANPDGTTTNRTFFRVRRARMRTTYETDVMRLFLQIDGLPAGGVGPGIGTILRNAEATGIARWTRDLRTEFTAGLFFTPFRAEILEISMVRPFIERTWFIQNAFPIERNYGVHAKTITLDDRLFVDLAIVNGQALGEKTLTALPDLNRSKDLIAYVNYRLGFVTLGASGYLGRGQVVDTQQLRFKQFSKWAVNYEASAKYRLLRNIGETRLSAELTIGQNMDVGTNYAFAVPKIRAAITDDVENLDQRALYVRFEQDFGRHFVVGYRFDTYTPSSDIKNNGRDTHAFLLVAKISPNLRFMNELDWAIDNVHDFGAPAPAKHIVSYSGVLQAMF